jgi:NAD(P)H-quinone oxidoreductase subunit 5
MPLRRNLSRSSRLPVRFLQDLFAYDVYLDKIYGATVVAAVAAIAKISTWFDRYVIDGIVNLVSLVTIFSGSALKYNVTGQSQFYLLTILVGVALLIWFSLSGQWMAIRQFWSSWLSLILP